MNVDERGHYVGPPAYYHSQLANLAAQLQLSAAAACAADYYDDVFWRLFLDVVDTEQRMLRLQFKTGQITKEYYRERGQALERLVRRSGEADEEVESFDADAEKSTLALWYICSRYDYGRGLLRVLADRLGTEAGQDDDRAAVKRPGS